MYGIDLWQAGTTRAQFKARTLGIENVVFVEGDASATKFDNEQFDLIVSSVGINNFENPQKVFAECYRIAKKGAQIAFATNPKGHMGEFYAVFEQTLLELKLTSALDALSTHTKHRYEVDTINKMLIQAGLSITKNQTGSFRWRFLDGTTFLNHHMIMRGFAAGWKEIIPPEYQQTFFKTLEARLNALAKEQGEFAVTIPTAYIEATR
jgi:arsenite methyltransferase